MTPALEKVIYPIYATVKSTKLNGHNLYDRHIQLPEINDCYRYLLPFNIDHENVEDWRGLSTKTLIVLMMNPSIANDHYGDPTTLKLLKEYYLQNVENQPKLYQFYEHIDLINIFPYVNSQTTKVKEWLNDSNRTTTATTNYLKANQNIIQILLQQITKQGKYDLLVATGNLNDYFGKKGTVQYVNVMNIFNEEHNKHYLDKILYKRINGTGYACHLSIPGDKTFELTRSPKPFAELFDESYQLHI
ncbi:hypothetical protein YK48G_12550 [Lentilactobacillus fungorum]|uniref:Uncharacterized protein n=1 Tax=Lentilactobacillus fungorum TaxID=2201250 RepID=A0ABQ3VZ38_9LACO|nr:DUF1643 domain-containing protein [Lentilactobacillus fungorum]GHP13830.1 hypothetical protein YK48G_12550 [Lentilactobacillus fungorum]